MQTSHMPYICYVNGTPRSMITADSADIALQAGQKVFGASSLAVVTVKAAIEAPVDDVLRMGLLGMMELQGAILAHLAKFDAMLDVQRGANALNLHGRKN